MHPLLKHGSLGYFWWFILVAHLYTSSSVRYGSSGKKFEDWSLDSQLLLSDSSQSSSTTHTEVVDSVSCEDLGGVGSFNTTCLINSNLSLNSDLHMYGTGNLEILPHVSVICAVEGCTVKFNLSGNVKVGHHATIIAGSVVFSAANLTMDYDSTINTTSLGGLPPSQTSGTPFGYDGAGGGHGGRGASCVKSNKTSNWGGDVYAWSSLAEPWSYGSKGSGSSAKTPYGGNGGGRVKLLVSDTLYINGSVISEGGIGGSNNGGGSGGSIFVHAVKL